MSASSIGAGRGGGYARYLEGKTIAPEQDDYYLTPDGELTEAPGRWLSDRETLARLGIDPDAPVERAQFIALMEGRHPGNGAWLRPAGADGCRGGGIDVTFSAPKSVSVVGALGDPWQREQIEAAHARAVERSMGYLKERVRSCAAAQRPGGWTDSVPTVASPTTTATFAAPLPSTAHPPPVTVAEPTAVPLATVAVVCALAATPAPCGANWLRVNMCNGARPFTRWASATRTSQPCASSVPCTNRATFIDSTTARTRPVCFAPTRSGK